MQDAGSIIVLDFETTGLSPTQGDRAIEIGAVKLQQGVIIDRFQALMNPGFRVSGFIEHYTGISNAMLSEAPSCEQVMHDFSHFIGDGNLVAHNASFDKRFLDAEMSRIDQQYRGQFACSMLLARRLFQQAPNHQLGTLVNWLKIENDGVFHRALNDAEVTTGLWLALLEHLTEHCQCQQPSFEFMLKLQQQPKASIDRFLRKWTQEG